LAPAGVEPCDWAVLVDAYHDGQLPATERQAFAAHLPGCASCARRLRDLQRLSDTFTQAVRPVPSEDAVARWHAAVEAADAGGDVDGNDAGDDAVDVRLRILPLVRVVRRMTAAAAAVLIAGSALLFHQGRTGVTGTGGHQGALDVERRVVMPGYAATPEELAGRPDRLAEWIVTDLAPAAAAAPDNGGG
jgi:anti-sigma factor RsiW